LGYECSQITRKHPPDMLFRFPKSSFGEHKFLENYSNERRFYLGEEDDTDDDDAEDDQCSEHKLRDFRTPLLNDDQEHT